MFVTDAGHADAVGAVHAEFFGEAAPATAMVVVSSLLDERWLVEIEAEAVSVTANG
jgi:enamine deaminase RidA (YjgF/YER057c/UK114 family)